MKIIYLVKRNPYITVQSLLYKKSLKVFTQLNTFSNPVYKKSIESEKFFSNTKEKDIIYSH